MFHTLRFQRRLAIMIFLAAVFVSLADFVNLLPGIAAKITPLIVASMILLIWSDSRRIRRLHILLAALPDTKFNTKSLTRPNKKRQPNPRPEYRAIAWHGFTLRSYSEVKIAKVLDKKGVLFLAAPKIRLDTENHRQTREVDFLIQHAGRWGILEVDGPHHQHSVQADQWRDTRFAQHGLVVLRFPADLCYRQPEVVVDDFLQKLTVISRNENADSIWSDVD